MVAIVDSVSIDQNLALEVSPQPAIGPSERTSESNTASLSSLGTTMVASH